MTFRVSASDTHLTFSELYERYADTFQKKSDDFTFSLNNRLVDGKRLIVDTISASKSDINLYACPVERAGSSNQNMAQARRDDLSKTGETNGHLPIHRASSRRPSSRLQFSPVVEQHGVDSLPDNTQTPAGTQSGSGVQLHWTPPLTSLPSRRYAPTLSQILATSKEQPNLPPAQLPTPPASTSPPAVNTPSSSSQTPSEENLNPVAFFTKLRTQLLVSDATVLSNIIFAALAPVPPALKDDELANEDDNAVLHNVAREILMWKGNLVKADMAASLAGFPEGVAEGEFSNDVATYSKKLLVEFIKRQTSHLAEVDRLWNEWKVKLCDDWDEHLFDIEDLEQIVTQQTSQLSLTPRRRRKTGGPPLAVRPPIPFRKNMLERATKRLLRDARLVHILGLVLEGWKAQLNLIPAWSTSGSYIIELRITQFCQTRIYLPPHAAKGRTVFIDMLNGNTHQYLVNANNEPHGSLSRRSGRLQIKPTRNYRFGRSNKRSWKQGEAAHPKDVGFWAQTMTPPPSFQAPRLPTPLSSTSSSPAPFTHMIRHHVQTEWTKLARAAGAAPIEFVNSIDDEEVPPGINSLFRYTERDYIMNFGISLPTKIVGCDCRQTCSHSSGPSCHQNTPAYNPHGLFMFNTHEIVECNKSCSCPPDCMNRVAQRPRQIPIQVVKTDTRGWGVQSPMSIPRGKMLGLYTGMLIKRETADHLTKASYCFDLDARENLDDDEEDMAAEHMYSVDAFPAGNWTRFINHSCDPNMETRTVIFDSNPTDNVGYIVFVACKDIPPFTELTFDYNPHQQRKFEMMSMRDRLDYLKNERRHHADTRCFCGSGACRGWFA
ncbi:SET-domain-containing protein [Mycena indigotica]|uniref:SET-domain-containing protein n=1 Tax=Mycena indigotica TaxID=2126181 RepID=A0A8H6W2X0_9AGAR|nr:SET-domain-containing protein [Mycena indigotica]KAF7303629.1 SET-domain-containing protein [Mycena indigotica]